MARIGSPRDRKAPHVAPARTWAIPEWAWLALALGGLAVAISYPDEQAAWMVRPAAIVVGCLGFYGLGRAHGQAHPDPIARGRVGQLERALTQLALLVGYDGAAGGGQRRSAGPSPAEHAADEGAEPEPRPAKSGGRPGIQRDISSTLAGGE